MKGSIPSGPEMIGSVRSSSSAEPEADKGQRVVGRAELRKYDDNFGRAGR